MTTVSGVRYPKGIVMASDLLVESKVHGKHEERKISYTDGLIWAFSETVPDRVPKIT